MMSKKNILELMGNAVDTALSMVSLDMPFQQIMAQHLKPAIDEIHSSIKSDTTMPTSMKRDLQEQLVELYAAFIESVSSDVCKIVQEDEKKTQFYFNPLARLECMPYTVYSTQFEKFHFVPPTRMKDRVKADVDYVGFNEPIREFTHMFCNSMQNTQLKRIQTNSLMLYGPRMTGRTMFAEKVIPSLLTETVERVFGQTRVQHVRMYRLDHTYILSTPNKIRYMETLYAWLNDVDMALRKSHGDAHVFLFIDDADTLIGNTVDISTVMLKNIKMYKNIVTCISVPHPEAIPREVQGEFQSRIPFDFPTLDVHKQLFQREWNLLTNNVFTDSVSNECMELVNENIINHLAFTFPSRSLGLRNIVKSMVSDDELFESEVDRTELTNWLSEALQQHINTHMGGVEREQFCAEKFEALITGPAHSKWIGLAHGEVIQCARMMVRELMKVRIMKQYKDCVVQPSAYCVSTCEKKEKSKNLPTAQIKDEKNPTKRERFGNFMYNFPSMVKRFFSSPGKEVEVTDENVTKLYESKRDSYLKKFQFDHELNGTEATKSGAAMTTTKAKTSSCTNVCKKCPETDALKKAELNCEYVEWLGDENLSQIANYVRAQISTTTPIKDVITFYRHALKEQYHQ